MVDQDLDSDAALPQQRRRSDEFAELAISTSFKPAAGGFIYRAPSAWFFRRAEHYLVTAEQRELILAALMPPVAIKPCPRWLVWVIAGGVAVSAIGLLAGPALLFADYPATGFLAGLGVLVATAIVSLRRVALRQRARLQPVLALAQPTNQRISLWSPASWSSAALRRAAISHECHGAGLCCILNRHRRAVTSRRSGMDWSCALGRSWSRRRGRR